MTSSRTDFLTPTGRLVLGSLYKAQTNDMEGRPLVVKSGANIGQPSQRFFFALAIAKGPEGHWANTEWGAKIWAAGHVGCPNAHLLTEYSWKIIDGDSIKPNLKGTRPCDREGYPGHWVLSYSSTFAPDVCNSDGKVKLTDIGAVKLGDYVQVWGSVEFNGSNGKPGVYLNHSAVALQGYGTEIHVGFDTGSVGFGGGALPAGASAVPIGAMTPPAPGAAPSSPPPPAAAPASPPPPATQTQTPVRPHPAFLTPGAPAPPAAAAPAPPSAPARQLTAKANGASYEQLIAIGWTDATLRAEGVML